MVTDREFLTAKPQIDASRPPVRYALASPLDDIRGIADEDMPDEDEDDEDEDEDDENEDDDEAEDFDEEEDYEEEDEESGPE